VAPDGHDLAILRGGYLHLTNQQFLLHRPSPSVDVTMQTAAEIFGSQAIGVLLTGMGRDGAIGMQQIHQAGGYTIAQNEATCTIYGMPRAAVEAGAAHEILAPDDIILALQRRISSA
jgi:two-component system chemotaxis response regulator CheB